MANSLREQWIAALRSDHYTQGHGMLHDSGFKMCCMGVLCDIIDPKGWVSNKTSTGFPCYSWRGFSSYPPEKLLNFSIADDLSELNDFDEQTFGEIADYLEAHPEINPTWRQMEMKSGKDY